MRERNPNIIWAAAFVAELAASGLTAVCIAPGSRSTPLTLAFAAHPQIKVYSHIDERCAAFFALGMALATDRPTAVVCTSGTATANFHPAIIEAHQSQVPLLILTGDRPHELRHSGANQTIDQVKMFGEHVLWSVDMGLPESEAPIAALNNVRATAARAYATANGLRKGTVHVNFPFRKPLEPSSPQQPIFDEEDLGATPRTTMLRGNLLPTASQVDELVSIIDGHKKGLIVCGPRCPGGEFPLAIMAFSVLSGYPIVADPLSGLRFWFDHEKQSELIVSQYETFLAAGVDAQPFEPPEVIIRFGAVPTSKWLNQYLDEITPAHRIHIRENGVWADDSHRTTLFLQANEVETCLMSLREFAPRSIHEWTNQVMQVEAEYRQATSTALATADFDAAYMVDLIALMPGDARLFVGNSLSIRHLDQFCGPTNTCLSVFGNRGASGIDGTVSCALGVGAVSAKPLVLVLGDVTFAHDLNGLLAAKQIDAPVTIVLFNNGGGGIFRRLPIAQFEPPFEELFLTPHELDFGSIVQGYGWDFVSVDNRADFQAAFAQSAESSTPMVIEVVTDGMADDEARRGLLSADLVSGLSGGLERIERRIGVDCCGEAPTTCLVTDA